MIELFQQYGLAYLFSDGSGLSGVAMTLWLFIISVVLGFALSIPLALARVSEHFWLRWPVEVYTYLFRGTPRIAPRKFSVKYAPEINPRVITPAVNGSIST